MGDKDPPEARMDTMPPPPMSNITRIADGQIRVDVEGNSGSDSPPTKRRNSQSNKTGKRSRSASASRAGGKLSRSSSSTRSKDKDLNSLVNENVLPKLDPTTLHCPKCDEKVSIDVAIRCSSCNSIFHATCGIVGNDPNVMPRKTWITTFVKHIAGKVNGDYVGGRFSWNCASCINVDFTADCKNLPDRLSNLETIMLKSTAARDAQIQTLTDAVVSLTKQLTDLTSSMSTPAASALNCDLTQTRSNIESVPLPPSNDVPTFADMASSSSTKTTNVPHASGSTAKVTSCSNTSLTTSPMTASSSKVVVPTSPQKPPTRRSNAKFILHVSKDDQDGVPMIKVLEKLAMAKKIGSYDFRSKGKFAVDLFFTSADDAKEAHSCLTKSVGSNVVVGLPEMVGSHKVFFVNIPEGVDSKGLLAQLNERWSDLSLLDAKKYCIKIFEPRKCIGDPTKIRSTVLLSDELYEFFMNKLNGRISLGYYTVLEVYDCLDQCIKCQSFEHTVESCRKKVSVCGYCGKNHHTKKCPVKEDASKHHCVNCFSDPRFKVGCSGHGAVSRDCPYYLQCIKNKDKH